MQQDKKRLKKLDFFSELEDFEDIMSEDEINKFSCSQLQQMLVLSLLILLS